ncbi:hypothetical protein GYMLUDRAFT_577865 [Collybiopsis luxurians FD-317 M1]|uniref:Unplaced genomic scaffold GYMLUscaffold_22, whole genome shotgun sequence n=1 Tax=Collybiopsis luxurians FD-317 M1 TaxID=944289 RepID=A0A0D0CRF6_9AGAR|nr:hypothetical protein GYMLUDRAFT_577865 [Collybiopsis luxurians FD-317 M1]
MNYFLRIFHFSLLLRDADHHEGIHGLPDANDVGHRKLPFSSLFNRTPALRMLQIRDFTMQTISTPSLALKSLTSIDLSSATLTSIGVSVNSVQVLNLLSQMLRLQYLKIIVAMFRSANEDEPTVCLDHLEEMCFVFFPGSRTRSTGVQNQMTSLLNKIQCPSLKSLSISWQGTLMTDIPF